MPRETERPDNDLYKVHSRWLGPAGYTLPVAIPFRAIIPGAVVAILLRLLLGALGASGLTLYATTAILTYLISKAAISATGPERPFLAIGSLLLAEITAPRPAPRAADTVAVLRPEAIAVRTIPVPKRRRGA